MAEEPVQRRLAAILAADVVGYSRLVQQDEAGTIAALRARRMQVLDPAVARHMGRIFKVAGDGVLVEFASAVNAVECAIDLQKAMAAANAGQREDRHIVWRIGVNLGDVMVEAGDLLGDGVNIAARLESAAEPGTVLISGAAYDHVKNKTSSGFEDLGVRTLKNMADPIRVYRVTDTPGVTLAPSRETAEKPSIAVLPFVNMSGDPEQEYFADGLTEDIIAALSRVSGLTVIARTSSFAYKGRSVDARRVASELKVRYVMEGSVRRAGGRVRVTAQLIDGITDHHVWTERYDHLDGDIFDIQDEIMRAVAASTETQIHLNEWQALGPRPSAEPKARDLVMRAWGRIFDFTPEALLEAGELAEQAIRLDPANPRAHIIRARAHLNRLWFGMIAHTDANVAMGLSLAETGVRLAPRDEWAHFCMAYAYEMAGRMEEAVAQCRKAIELNPNFSNGYSELGRSLAASGETGQAIEACRMALRLNPRDPSNWERHSTLALAHFAARDYEESLREALIATQDRMIVPEGLIILAAASAALGNMDEARRAAARCLARWPGIRIGAMTPIYIPRYAREEDHERLATMLRQAGFPD